MNDRPTLRLELFHDAANMLCTLDEADGPLEPPPHVREWLEALQHLLAMRIEGTLPN